jgi:hypothetical protein
MTKQQKNRIFVSHVITIIISVPELYCNCVSRTPSPEELLSACFGIYMYLGNLIQPRVFFADVRHWIH